MKFYVCEHCGNIITFAKNTGVPVMCCGQKMTEIVPGSTDAAVEKHVPVIKADGAKVTVEVSTVEHPMTEAHYIEWVVLETAKGYQKVDLTPDQAPKAEFALAEGDSVITAYAYCNLHGLWKAE